MNNSGVSLSDVTPRVAEFFLAWYSAREDFTWSEAEVRKIETGESDISRNDLLRNLETQRINYNYARKLRDEAHPDAHLMLMPKVRGGWLARWRCELKGAKLWKHQYAAFESDFKRFNRYYQSMTNPKEGIEVVDG